MGDKKKPGDTSFWPVVDACHYSPCPMGPGPGPDYRRPMNNFSKITEEEALETVKKYLADGFDPTHSTHELDSETNGPLVVSVTGSYWRSVDFKIECLRVLKEGGAVFVRSNGNCITGHGFETMPLFSMKSALTGLQIRQNPNHQADTETDAVKAPPTSVADVDAAVVPLIEFLVNDCEGVKQHLDKGSHQMFACGSNAIQFAVKKNMPKCAACLVKAGATVDEAVLDLAKALENGSETMTKALTDNKP